jgi:hypothetical protein
LERDLGLEALGAGIAPGLTGDDRSERERAEIGAGRPRRGAIAAGLPVVICPLLADQTANAGLVQEAGAGLAVFPSDDAAGGLRSLGSADIAALRDAIDSVLTEPRYLQTAGRLAVEMAGT